MSSKEFGAAETTKDPVTMNTPACNTSPGTRRAFLTKAMSASVCTLSFASICIAPAAAKTKPASGKESRRLRLVNVHTQEKISVVYRKGNVYLPSALNQIDFLLRDYRANEIMKIDTKAIDYLYEIYAAMDTTQHIQIMSGYRSQATNEMLRKRSKRVAKNSLHIVGKAIDFRIPGRKTKHLQMAALDLKLGGIGYYQKSDFVHIDSGSFRSW